jgi:Na+/phosphate symporter
LKHCYEAPEGRHGLERAAGSPHRIANAHTLFNLLLAFVALPFLPWGAPLARWIVAAPPGAGKPHVQYL